jgi:hypothetical protein
MKNQAVNPEFLILQERVQDYCKKYAISNTTLQDLITTIHKELLLHLTQVSISSHTTISMSTFSVNTILHKTFHIHSSYIYKQKENHVVFPGITGSPLDHLDMICEKIIELLPSLIESYLHNKPREIIMSIVGYPHTFNGSISHFFMRHFNKNGFMEYGKIYANLFVNTLFLQSKKEIKKIKIILHGQSMGTQVAANTAVSLMKLFSSHKTQPSSLEVFLHNPAGYHTQFLKGAQTIFGYFGETLIRKIFDATIKYKNSKKTAFLRSLSPNQYKQSFFSTYRKLVHLASLGILLVKGSPIPLHPNVKYVIKRGFADPVTTSFIDIKRFMRGYVRGSKEVITRKSFNVKEILTQDSHNLRFYSFSFWIYTLDVCNSIIQANYTQFVKS